MGPAEWVTIIVLTLLLAEGFALVFFPDDIRRMLADIDPKMLQTLGVVELSLAAALVATLWTS